MNKKDIAEIRRRLNAESHNPIDVRGLYVNGKGAVVSAFHKSLMSLPQEEAESYLAIFKRLFSGDFGKNLSMIHFPMDEVMEGECHGRLMDMNRDKLMDDELANEFFTSIIENTHMEGNYLILLLHDTYDVAFKTRSGEIDETADSENVFSYILCAICPVKMSKSALCYFASENDFGMRDQDWVVSAPDMGFMFPAFEDGGANIHDALYYTKDISNTHTDFTLASLGIDFIAAPAENKEAFQSLLVESLQDECSMEVVQAVNEQLIARVAEQKADKEAETACVSKEEVSKMLTGCGISEEKTEAFEKNYDETFGNGMDIPAASIVNERQFEVRTPDVVVRVSPEHANLIETRIIDGVKYILIKAEEGVTVNGMSVGM